MPSTAINGLISGEQTREGQTVYATINASMKVEPVESLHCGDTRAYRLVSEDAIRTLSEVVEKDILDIACGCCHQNNAFGRTNSIRWNQ